MPPRYDGCRCTGYPVTETLSKSGAYAVGLPNWIVLVPATRVSVTVIVPGVLKLPVGVNVRVWPAPPLTLTTACRPVVEPSQYAIATWYLPAAGTLTPLKVSVA